MFEIKKVTLKDNGVEKSFTISPLSARAAIHLLREILMLFTDTDLIHAVVLKAFIHRVVSTGTEIEGAEQNELQELMQMDMPLIITNLIKSMMNGLSENSTNLLIDKCLEKVVYNNGTLAQPAIEVLDAGMIKDFTVVIDLMHEVLMINYAPVIERIKKALAPHRAAETTAI